MGAIVGPGIKAAMDAAQDSPVTNEWTEQNGPAKIVKAYGTKGLYVASDDSGQWVTAGPFEAAD